MHYSLRTEQQYDFWVRVRALPRAAPPSRDGRSRSATVTALAGGGAERGGVHARAGFGCAAGSRSQEPGRRSAMTDAVRAPEGACLSSDSGHCGRSRRPCVCDGDTSHGGASPARQGCRFTAQAYHDARGNKDRMVMRPDRCEHVLLEQRRCAHVLRAQDRADGLPGVEMLESLARKYPHVAAAWLWFWVWPLPTLSVEPRSHSKRRNCRKHSKSAAASIPQVSKVIGHARLTDTSSTFRVLCTSG